MSILPSISCVVIGLNSEGSIIACLESVKASSYSNISEIVYVDGGSRDKSVALARSISGIKIIELNLKNPSQAKGRNAGWRTAKGEWIHFIDSDTIVDKDWFSKAIKYVDDNTAAVFGLRKELYPTKNVFHFIADLEWPRAEPEPKFFGGDILVRRFALEEAGGYDEELIDGDDPETSVRIRANGWRIKGVDSIMCYHDINMDSLSGYVKRSLRSGYGYPEAGVKMLKYGEKTWILKTIKIFIKAILVFSLITLALFSRQSIYGTLVVAIIFFPLLKTRYFQKKFKISFKQAFIYALHCSVVIWIHFCGVLKYCFKAAGKKLGFRNIF